MITLVHVDGPMSRPAWHSVMAHGWPGAWTKGQRMAFEVKALAVRLAAGPLRFLQPDGDATGSAGRSGREFRHALPDGVEWFRPFPDGSHEVAEFLLDPAGYRAAASWEQRERSMPFRIVQGDRYAGEARGGQGVRWRCSDAEFLARAVLTIDALDPTALRQEFSLAELVERGVDGVHETDDEMQTCERAMSQLHGLARFYARLADEKLDVLIVRD